MNGNRTKYTYTPTYGMQKKGGLKRGVPVREVPETPDFTSVPDPTIGVPLQQTTPQGSFYSSAPAPQAANMAVPSYFSNPQPPLPVQPSMPVQMPFVAPTFVQQGGVQPPYSLVQNTSQQSYQQPPLGNSIHNANKSGGFSARNQGFVPPQMHPQQIQQPVVAAPVGWVSAKPASPQSVPPFSGMQSASQPTAPFAPAQQPAASFPQFQPVPQQTGYTIQPNETPAAPRTAAFDADKLWTVFLFGLLPLVFIPCLFVSNSWDVLRYLFLGMSVVGLGVMWYRQQYTPASRLIISMVYVAICVVTIAMLMQGSSDSKQAAANMAANNQMNQVQETPSANDNHASAPAETPTPTPTIAPPSEAERRLSLFMELWKVNNTTEMVNLVQPSWRSQQENAPTSLFLALGTRTPEDFVIEEISGSETDNSRTITMRATINKNTGKPPVVYRFMIMMVKEGGEWYVNPNSLATNDTSGAKTEDENVVNSQSSGTITEPPRETVTPAPPASTLLYYNQGGNYYHMDPNCPDVAKEYLPFDASFPYSDLRSYNKNLLPCLTCNAPIDPL